jgi:inner membrane protein
MVFGRRGITHSVFVMPFEVLLLGLAFRRWTAFKDPLPVFGCAAAGVFLHTGMDVFNSWGVRLLAPFSDSRFGNSWVGIVDPWIWGLLAAGLATGFLKSSWSPAANRTALALLVPWAVFCGLSHGLAVAHFREALARIRVRPERIEAYSQVLTPLQWNVVAATSDRFYQGDVHALAGLKGRLRVYFRTPIPDALAGPFTRSYLLWAGAPIVRPLAAEQGGGFALVDLRFLNRAGGIPFVARLAPDSLGRPEHAWLGWHLGSPVPDQEFELPPL